MSLCFACFPIICSSSSFFSSFIFLRFHVVENASWVALGRKVDVSDRIALRVSSLRLTAGHLVSWPGMMLRLLFRFSCFFRCSLFVDTNTSMNVVFLCLSLPFSSLFFLWYSVIFKFYCTLSHLRLQSPGLSLYLRCSLSYVCSLLFPVCVILFLICIPIFPIFVFSIHIFPFSFPIWPSFLHSFQPLVSFLRPFIFCSHFLSIIPTSGHAFAFFTFPFPTRLRYPLPSLSPTLPLPPYPHPPSSRLPCFFTPIPSPLPPKPPLGSPPPTSHPRRRLSWLTPRKKDSTVLRGWQLN